MRRFALTLSLALALPAALAQTPHPELAEPDIATLQSQMRDGGISSVALTQAYLDRIAALDDAGPRLDAVIELNPDALADAKRLDDERRSGKLRGPLHGIPILLKDNIDVLPMANSAGSLALANHHPKTDAFLVQRLRDAGAVILGKTNLSEWANFRSTRSSSGWSSRGGQTRNPYALDRSPCGSSAGTGSAIAAGLAVVGIGTETDGSIICPSAVAGLVGLKPTVGLVSRDGIIPISASQDTAGPMTRNVRDAALLLAAIAARDDADQADALPGRPAMPPDYASALLPDALKGVRIGVLRHDQGKQPDVDAAFARALDTLKAQGATLVDAEIATAGQWDDDEYTVLLYEFKDGLNRYLSSRKAPVSSLAGLIEWNRTHAAKAMPWFAQEIFEAAQAKGLLTDKTYREAKARARRLAGPEGIDATLAKHRLDALVAPAMSPAWLIDPMTGDHFTFANYGAAAVAGTPSLTVPMGNAQGLPIGLVFMGPAWSEARLLGYGQAFEQAAKARTSPTYAPTLTPRD